MDASLLSAQVSGLAPGVHCEHLGDNADRDLLRTVGGEVEADGREQPVRFGRAELAEDLLLPRARPEQTQVRERLGKQRAQPVASTWPLEPNTERQSTRPVRRNNRGSPGPGSPWVGT